LEAPSITVSVVKSELTGSCSRAGPILSSAAPLFQIPMVLAKKDNRRMTIAAEMRFRVQNHLASGLLPNCNLRIGRRSPTFRDV